MKKLTTFVLELCRIIVLFALTLYVLDLVERNLLKIITGRTEYYWSMTVGNLFIFFVIYRNYFQFNGWYKSEQNLKLSKTATRLFILISLGLIIVPILINFRKY